MDILLNLLKRYSTREISEIVNITENTVKRWVLLHKVPKQYIFELMKMNDTLIDYSKFDYKDKDQYYTPRETSKYCYLVMKRILEKYKEDEKQFIYIEPSAGNGSFLETLPENRRIGIDIEPKNEEIKQIDYIYWVPNNDKRYIVIGNPPFGLRGQLALKFINHSSKFADFVCFILPQLFESDGKGSPRKRVCGMNLIHSEKINNKFETPGGKEIKIECIYQIWSKKYHNKEYDIKNITNRDVKIYSLSDGGGPSSTRNKKMLYSCDIYIPSTVFGKENMRYYKDFDSLPGRKGYGIVFTKDKEKNLSKFVKVDWTNKSFLSTNSAYNIRTSQIIEALDSQV